MESFMVNRCILQSTRSVLQYRQQRRSFVQQKIRSINHFQAAKLRWIAVPVGIGSLVYYVYSQIHVPEPNGDLVNNWQVTLYRKMPLKTMSRWWGQFNDLSLPVFLRKPILGLYIWMFNVNLAEAQVENLTDYKNLGEFFRRTLKPHVRSVDDDHVLTSPADGKVLHYGSVHNGVLEQVKGMTYSLRGFFGPNIGSTNMSTDNIETEEDYHSSLGIQPGNLLYHCVIYLAPGDYHRFHSPAQWTIQHRRHFPGELLSVNPGVARWIQGLFNFNERVVYTGNWEHGFFSLTAVGATNVGSIKIYCDENLTTNKKTKYSEGTYFDERFQKNIQVEKGEMFGEFNLGSTIVLVFEAPKNFEFKITNGQKIKFGQPVGDD